MNNQELINIESNRNLGIKFINYIKNYLFHWKWFAISIILFLIIGKIKLMYTPPIYEASATILIKDPEKTASLNEMPAIQDLGLASGGKSIDNEIEILKSRTLMRRVVEKLDLNIQYFVDEETLNLEKFKDQPININFINGKKNIYDKNATFIIQPINNNKYILKDSKGKNAKSKVFGETVNSKIGKFIITPTNFLKNNLNKDITIKVSKILDVSNKYRNDIQIIAVNKLADAILLSLKDSNKDKAIAIINTLINEHKLDEIEDKNELSRNTSNFIDSRLDLISKELDEVERGAQSFKTKNKLVNAISESEMFLTLNAETEKNFIQNNTQLAIMEYMLEYIREHANEIDLLPSNLGVSDISLNQMINSYNTIVLERNRLVKNSSSINPVIFNLENQIHSLQKSIKEGLINLKSSLTIQNKQLAKQEKKINSKIESVPKFEREFRNIQRQQQIKENLYLYLLQKKEESSISLAITTSNSKILDEAYADDKPISPVKKLTYFSSIVLGILTPIIFIFIFSFFDIKVKNKLDLTNLGIPYIGDIPLSSSSEKLVVGKTQRTNIAEAFRFIRTNISFLIPSSKNYGKSIFITSTLSNEGKSFIALNLAATLGLSNKKVVLVGLDLRAPKILEYINMKRSVGVSSYIIDPKITLDEIQCKIPENENLTIIPSGPIPPNPAELLMSERLSELFAELKSKYDFIVVDTAPVGLVTDSLLLDKYADLFIYVTRANYLDKRLLNIPENLFEEGKIRNMTMLLNCSDHTSKGGYGYTYGYGEDNSYLARSKKSWFNKFWNKTS